MSRESQERWLGPRTSETRLIAQPQLRDAGSFICERTAMLLVCFRVHVDLCYMVYFLHKYAAFTPKVLHIFRASRSTFFAPKFKYFNFGEKVVRRWVAKANRRWDAPPLLNLSSSYSDAVGGIQHSNVLNKYKAEIVVSSSVVEWREW